PRKLAPAVISRIKVMGRMDIAEQLVPQDGRATVTIGDATDGATGRAIDLRISTLPTRYGERAVIRLLDKSQQMCDFDRLGMSAPVAEQFVARARLSHGIILVTGPTGSGKTTTLYSTLRLIGSPDVNIMTIEDPIEYDLSSLGLAISQAQVNTRKGITFATGLRHILRQDPDIVMVGEIRDMETARIAIQSSLTGHLVFSTLHTNDAVSAITRLIDLGVEPYLVGASLSAVLAQRLVRLVHESCAGAGCETCLGTGFSGRTGLFELMVVSEAIRELIGQSASLGDLRRAAEESGLRTLREVGHALADARRTAPEEVARVVVGL
ncbi:MAG: type II/IV secretion system protein, partial [Planctomycetes bacterium]|nr:type II/IV secretion system protein [Planctomycetota bacterium]